MFILTNLERFMGLTRYGFTLSQIKNFLNKLFKSKIFFTKSLEFHQNIESESLDCRAESGNSDLH